MSTWERILSRTRSKTSITCSKSLRPLVFLIKIIKHILSYSFQVFDSITSIYSNFCVSLTGIHSQNDNMKRVFSTMTLSSQSSPYTVLLKRLFISVNSFMTEAVIIQKPGLSGHERVNHLHATPVQFCILLCGACTYSDKAFINSQ